MSSDEYLKLPTYHVGDAFDVYIQMNKEHLQICKDIEDGYLNILDSRNSVDREIYVENEISERSKLLQVYSGFIYHVDAFKNKTPVQLEWNPKLTYILKYLKADLDEPTNNVIIWTRFREELDIIYKRLSQDYLCAYGMGGMTDKQQQQQLDLWLNNPKCRIMIAHPGAFMYGHTWNKANFTYYSSSVDDNNQYSQSRKRNHRRGQTREVTERKFILKDTLEKDVWNSIVRKIRLDKFLKR
jgi:SNF2 family DNA or RNA helicase